MPSSLLLMKTLPNSFQTKKGVHQACLLTLLVFNLFLNDLNQVLTWNQCHALMILKDHIPLPFCRRSTNCHMVTVTIEVTSNNSKNQHKTKELVFGNISKVESILFWEQNSGLVTLLSTQNPKRFLIIFKVASIST